MGGGTEQSKTATSGFQPLFERISSGEARVCVIGLGTAGLPFLTAVAQAGFPSTGIDINQGLVDEINRGSPPQGDADTDTVRRLVAEGKLVATSDFSAVADSDCVVISVPTYSSLDGEPDIGPVLSALRETGQRLRRGQLVIIESTVPPGTTRGEALLVLASSGLTVGADFFLAFSPERIDPGNASFATHNIPKVVGGVTEDCTTLAARFYSNVVTEVHPVSSAEVAEMAKVFENTFRFVNISLANELSQVCDRLAISAAEVLDAAATKPFAFMRHSPGPGVGGRCLPMAAHYLRWAASQHGAEAGIVNAAIELNDLVPELVAKEAETRARDAATGDAEPTVLLIGVAYKPGVGDVRGSVALTVASILVSAGVRVQYHDPFVPAASAGGKELMSVPLTPEVIRRAGCTLILCPHKTIDYASIREHSRSVVDPTYTIRDLGSEGSIPS